MKRRLKFSTLWAKLSKKYRELHPVCEVCGSKDHLNVHHILSRKHYREYALDESNLICLCAKHHTFGKQSAHKNGIWFSEWLRINLP